YTARATASGAGRNGTVKSNDGTATPLDIKLSMPKALGGDGKGHNPEQLFASGYSACFLGALQAVAAQKGKKDAVKEAKIDVAVHIGPPTDKPGFGIAVDIKVHGVHDKDLVEAAHEFCPYSRTLAHGAVVKVTS
ncbi:OsmC/Ohr family, partial [Cantharellus anzutake]|uniref:OsmC/Ohr family n=1 Tax=Cantharellus anzutake TaxID=1750568 RepID=UPI001904DE36